MFTSSSADVTPPTLTCPLPFSVPMIEDDDFAIVRIFPAPNVTGKNLRMNEAAKPVTILLRMDLKQKQKQKRIYFLDNSDENITYWLKPSVKEDGVKLTLGTHTFNYIAVDAFRNKAKCSFNITVLDITPPNIDNCINPPEIYIPSAPNLISNRTFVDWDAPIIYDNSNTDVNITQSIQPGNIGIGMHSVVYTATDLSGNQNDCTLNLTVKPLQCNTLLSPGNGQSLCARNETHTWCDVICDLGFTIYDADDEQSDHVRLLCENDNPQWAHDPLPDCTKIELPETIEQVFSITLDDDVAICGRNNSQLTAAMVENLLTSQIR